MKIHDLRLLEIKEEPINKFIYFYFNSVDYSLSEIKSTSEAFTQLMHKSLVEAIAEFELIVASSDQCHKKLLELHIYIDNFYNEFDFVFYVNLMQTYAYLNILCLNLKTIFKLLGVGLHAIYLSETVFTLKGIGLLPIELCVVSTRGLRWNLDKDTLKIGGNLISSSNELSDCESEMMSRFQVVIESGSLIVAAERCKKELS